MSAVNIFLVSGLSLSLLLSTVGHAQEYMLEEDVTGDIIEEIPDDPVPDEYEDEPGDHEKIDKKEKKKRDKELSSELKAINTLISLNCSPALLGDLVAYMDCVASYAQGYEGPALVDVLDKKNISTVFEYYSDTFMDQCLTAVSDAALATFDNTTPDWTIAYTKSAIQCTEYHVNVIADADYYETLKSLYYIISQ